MRLKTLLSIVLACVGLVTTASAQITIKPNTAIKISIAGVPPEETSRVSNDYAVSASGTINLPFIGVMSVGGMAPSAAAQRIQSAYQSAKIYRNCTIQVFSDATGSTLERQVVYVAGRVRSPGEKPFVQGLTALQALAAAGGADEFGAIKRVQLTRGGKVKVLNMEQAQFKSYVLEQNDQIEVLEKNWLGN